MCYQQENLHTRLVLSGHTTSSSPCLPVRILSLYGEFNGAQPNVLSILSQQQYSSFKAVSLKQDLVWELWAEHTVQG